MIQMSYLLITASGDNINNFFANKINESMLSEDFTSDLFCYKYYYYFIIEMNMALNLSVSLLSISRMGFDFPTKKELILSLFDEISHTDDLILFGIHSKNDGKIAIKFSFNCWNKHMLFKVSIFYFRVLLSLFSILYF